MRGISDVVLEKRLPILYGKERSKVKVRMRFITVTVGVRIRFSLYG